MLLVTSHLHEFCRERRQTLHEEARRAYLVRLCTAEHPCLRRRALYRLGGWLVFVGEWLKHHNGWTATPRPLY
jgi:hypothetical protein